VIPAAVAGPFSTGALLVWDSLRVLVIGGGLAVMILGVRVLARTELRSRMLLTAGLFCFVTSAVGTEIENLGAHVSYRLFFNLLGVLVAGGGMWRARRET
jgi:hypothetical protein